jgi:hypothetical protein
MFIQDYTEVAAPYDMIRPRFEGPAALWLAGEASQSGEKLTLQLRPRSGPVRLAKRVHVDVGEPRCGDTVTVVPLSWFATGTTGLFPTMEADLEIAPFGAATVITFLGRYEPPLGAIGRGLDRALLHRVAAATVRAFLHRVAGALATEAAA